MTRNFQMMYFGKTALDLAAAACLFMLRNVGLTSVRESVHLQFHALNNTALKTIANNSHRVLNKERSSSNSPELLRLHNRSDRVLEILELLVRHRRLLRPELLARRAELQRLLHRGHRALHLMRQLAEEAAGRPDRRSRGRRRRARPADTAVGRRERRRDGGRGRWRSYHCA